MLPSHCVGLDTALSTVRVQRHSMQRSTGLNGSVPSETYLASPARVPLAKHTMGGHMGGTQEQEQARSTENAQPNEGWDAYVIVVVRSITINRLEHGYRDSEREKKEVGRFRTCKRFVWGKYPFRTSGDHWEPRAQGI